MRFNNSSNIFKLLFEDDTCKLKLALYGDKKLAVSVMAVHLF